MKILKLLSIVLFLLIAGCLDTSSPEYDDSKDQEFLEEYAQRENVTTTSSGLMYRVIEEGEGEMPTSNQQVIVNYVGESVRKDREISPTYTFEVFIPDGLTTFPGIGEGVQLMKEGARFEFVVPSELGQGDGRAYIFDLTLESFLRKDQEQFLVDNAELEDIEVTATGLQYRILEEGDGEKPTITNSVKAKYKGTLTSGYIFDQSKNDESTELKVNGVIPGFSEGLQLMNEGARYEFFIPPELGYGNQFPQYNNVLRFEVELVEVL